MATTTFNIVVPQGARFAFSIQALNEDKTVKDLSGYSGRMQVRASVDSVDILLEATTANGRISIDGPAGVVSVNVGADITAPMTWTSGVYDLEVFTASPAEVIRLVEGYAYLSKEVTR
jgi:hypothetical protein